MLSHFSSLILVHEVHISYGSGYYYILLILLLLECTWEAIISFIAVGGSILYQSGSTWANSSSALKHWSASEKGTKQMLCTFRCVFAISAGRPSSLLIAKPHTHLGLCKPAGFQPSERMFGCCKTSYLKTPLQMNVSLFHSAFVAAQ